jgi:hypothetical protein
MKGSLNCTLANWLFDFSQVAFADEECDSSTGDAETRRAVHIHIREKECQAALASPFRRMAGKDGMFRTRGQFTNRDA